MGATTTVQYRVSGTTTWTTFGTTGVNAVTQPITGLTGNTEYDVRVYHNKDGFESTKLVKTQLFKTLNPSVLPPITNFIVLSCRQEVTNGKTFNYFTMGWTSAPSPPGSSFQIASNSANNPATGSIMITVPDPTSGRSWGLELESDSAEPLVLGSVRGRPLGGVEPQSDGGQPVPAVAGRSNGREYAGCSRFDTRRAFAAYCTGGGGARTSSTRSITSCRLSSHTSGALSAMVAGATHRVRVATDAWPSSPVTSSARTTRQIAPVPSWADWLG